jgi:hypothetical protein
LSILNFNLHFVIIHIIVFMYKLFLVLLVFVLGGLPEVFGQSVSERQNIKAKTKVDSLRQFAGKKDKEYRLKKAKLHRLAKKNDWVIFESDDKGNYRELAGVNSKGVPVYVISHNADAANSVRTNTLHSGGSLGLELEGQNMTIYLWDWGHGRASHQEYADASGISRMTVADSDAVLNNHAAHLIGTLIASGVEAQVKGMAPQAHAVVYKWNNDVFEAAQEAQNGMLISTHSYGPAAGSSDDDAFGQYGLDAADWDELMHYAPYYLMVVSAGNVGNDGFSNAYPLEGNSNYDKLLGHKTAKNNLVVANAQDANIDENGNLISAQIHSTSSQGPTDDYRIKPDISGNGTGLYSTLNSSDSDYGYKTGTSMASPNVAGSLILLQQHYNNTHGHFMRASSLKGLVLHTADDISSEGPDAVSGWGLLNAKSAAQVISDHGRFSLIDERIINEGETHHLTINSDGMNDMEVSISWTDPPAEPNQNLNDNTPVLINDLDLRITKNNDTFEPYKLTSVSTVGKGDNTVDPFEKIRIGGASGTYTITVSHKGSLQGVNQEYSLIITGIQNEAPEITEISPNTIYKDRGKIITIIGTGLLGCEFSLGEIPGELLYASDSEARVRFPAADYLSNTLTVSNASGIDEITTEIKTRTVLPVDISATDNSDEHHNIQSALEGLQAWLGSSLYTQTYTVVVSGGSYEGGILFNSGMNPTADHPLIIKNADGQSPEINAQTNDYGMYLLGLKHTAIQGFTIFGAHKDNLKTEGDNLIIAYNQTYDAQVGAGIYLGNSNNVSLFNNLSYNNAIHGLYSKADNLTAKNNTLADNGASVIPQENARLFYDDVELGLQAWESNGDIYLYALEDPQYYVSENTALFICGASDLFINLAEPIDISDYTNLSVSAYLRFNLSGTVEETNIIRFEYSFDNENWTEVINLTTDDSGIDEFQKYETPGISPESDKLYLRFYVLVNDAEEHWDESWIIDDVEVTGDEDFIAYDIGSALYIESGNGISLENNILTAKAGNDDYFALRYPENLVINSNYNTYFTTNSHLFNCNGIPSNTGPTGANDISSDPLFVNSGLDYHLQSVGGSFVGGEWPPLSAQAGSWEAQISDSPALDAGNPNDEHSKEPAGGSAINQGAYGDTPQASKTLSVSVSAELLEICKGEETQLKAEAYGGTEPYNYLWTSNSGDFISDLANPTVNPGQTSTYSLTVSDAHENIIYDSIRIVVNSETKAGKIIGSTELCPGNNSTELALTENRGEVLKWRRSDDNGQTWADIDCKDTVYMVSNIEFSALYKAVVRNKNCSVKESEAGSISVIPLPELPDTVSAQQTKLCENENTLLEYSGGSGDEFVWYQYSCGDENIGVGNYLNVFPDSTSTYFGRWENDCGVTDCKSVTIMVDKLILANAGKDDYVCSDRYTLSANFSEDGNAGWEILKGDALISDITDPKAAIFPKEFPLMLEWKIINGECISSDTLLLKAADSAQIIKQPENKFAVSGAEVSFSIKASGTNLSFQWRKDGIDLQNSRNYSGVNSPQLVICSADQSHAGIYDVCVSGACGDIYSDSAELFVALASGNVWIQRINVFPNPTSGVLNIEFPKAHKNITIQAEDFSGRLLWTETIEASKTFRTNMGHLPSGIYFIKIYTVSQSAVFKVFLH